MGWGIARLVGGVYKPHKLDIVGPVFVPLKASQMYFPK